MGIQFCVCLKKKTIISFGETLLKLFLVVNIYFKIMFHFLFQSLFRS